MRKEAELMEKFRELYEETLIISDKVNRMFETSTAKDDNPEYVKLRERHTKINIVLETINYVREIHKTI